MTPAQDLFTAIATASVAGAVYGLAEGWVPAKLLDGDASFSAETYACCASPAASFSL